MTVNREGSGAAVPGPDRGETPEERRARWRSVAIGANALPTRSRTQHEWDRMKRWEGEHDAAKQLKAAGITPPTLADAPKMVQELNG